MSQQSLSPEQFSQNLNTNLSALPEKAHTGDIGFKFHEPNSSAGRAYDKTATDLSPATREMVPLNKLHTVQHSVVRDRIRPPGNNELPQMTRHKGKTWVDDGHHRLAHFMLGGATHAEAMVRNIK
jgi:hypothetical protein